MPASVWGGIVLAGLGGGILLLAWPRDKETHISKIEEEEPKKSELEKTIIMALRAYLDEKARRRSLRAVAIDSKRSVS